MSDAAQRLLSENVGQVVLVKLRGGKLLRGVLRSFDQHLNIVLDNAEEVGDSGNTPLGKVIIRGENVILVSPA
ncbi:MAG: RNA-binding protein [Desulfurococcales archaeon]|nr:RNA-binding protein [Desulfurococcales archaeon]